LLWLKRAIWRGSIGTNGGTEKKTLIRFDNSRHYRRTDGFQIKCQKRRQKQQMEKYITRCFILSPATSFIYVPFLFNETIFSANSPEGVKLEVLVRPPSRPRPRYSAPSKIFKQLANWQ
jgi:hypothetical protein